MGGWDEYAERMGVTGDTKRDMWVARTKQSVLRRMVDSPSYRLVSINSIEQYVSITHRVNSMEKRICSRPGETLKHGGLVEFDGSKWLITDIDADSVIYSRGLMRRCNHILRWISKEGKLREKWCIVEDGTKYLIGEATARYDSIMTIGDARIAVTVGRDDETIELDRGLRFLIDDADAEHPQAYQITKSNRFFNAYDGEGVFRFILNEVTRTENDNIKERIADYTSWMPERALDSDHKDSEYTVAQIVSAAQEAASVPPSDEKENWL